MISYDAPDERWDNDVLRSFSLGADDYVTKPFSFAQLFARIRAVLARGGKTDPAGGKLRGGDLEVDVSTHRVTRGGEPITSPRPSSNC